MKEGPDISHLAALIGDPARANMLTALMSGQALTARELAIEAGITPQTASSHLKKLQEGQLITQRKQGRHRYFALAGPEVSAVLESLMGLASGTGQRRSRVGPKDAALRHARVCYNHLAGQRGVQMYDSLLHQKMLVLTPNGMSVSPAGEAFLTGFGVDLVAISTARPLCRDCLDWSERRSHLGGALGRAVLAQLEIKGWARRSKDSRAVSLTSEGQRQFDRAFPPRGLT
ncbi:winged helix-turn-helix domain-containing protein [Celeribacter baekdonensis]|uniref:ArsR/SmtB family transcription factor n=1 Tax=Celeribacter baekdonensis TaxID=875171 RepID=UPI0030D7CD2B|tara:strand:+ start:174384 stop:175073 length:690 start_codon:yes stop_codon:yes gene_type:complete